VSQTTNIPHFQGKLLLQLYQW